MNKIIITGHGNYATGMLSALVTISGPKENVEAIDFTSEDTDQTLNEKIIKLINKNDCYLILCDLLGGTPYKEATKISLENKNIKVITGANLGSILDCSMKLDKLAFEELPEKVIQASQKNLKIIKLEPIKEEARVDGI